jgi:hypothetical protein
MHSMTVLLLDMTYSGQGLKEESFSVIPSINKLIGWLWAMQNDPLAARAYAVVHEILGSSAPNLRPKADALLALDRTEMSQAQTSHHSRELPSKQSLKQWQELGLADNIASDPDSFNQWLFDDPPGYQPPTFQYFSGDRNLDLMFCENSICNSCDQDVSFLGMSDL